jgi:hypothetical protein
MDISISCSVSPEGGLNGNLSCQVGEKIMNLQLTSFYKTGGKKSNTTRAVRILWARNIGKKME